MFPKNFLWGAATSSHQVEGGNSRNDWWQWENEGRVKTKSGDAVRQYELFDRDFELAKKLSHNSHRFSMEWSRIEPQEGKFDTTALDHYHRVLDALLKRSIVPFVTLHHFTNPLWFAEKGAWLNPRCSEWFSRYTAKVVEAFKDKVRYWVTINEPLVLAYHGYLTGLWPPGHTSFPLAMKMVHGCIAAHKQAYQIIHKIYAGSQPPLVGIAHNMRPFQVCPRSFSPFHRLHAFGRHYLFNLYFLERIKNAMDFIGVNYYEREFIGAHKGAGLFGDNCNVAHQHSTHLNQMGWGFYPEGLGEVLHFIKKYNKPVIITENGTAEDYDQDRARFIKANLREIEKAIDEDIDVRGYFYWSLVDNFEWERGFGPRFGLVEIDYKTFERRPRASAYVFKEIIERGRVDA